MLSISTGGLPPPRRRRCGLPSPRRRHGGLPSPGRGRTTSLHSQVAQAKATWRQARAEDRRTGDLHQRRRALNDLHQRRRALNDLQRRRSPSDLPRGHPYHGLPRRSHGGRRTGTHSHVDQEAAARRATRWERQARNGGGERRLAALPPSTRLPSTTDTGIRDISGIRGRPNDGDWRPDVGDQRSKRG